MYWAICTGNNHQLVGTICLFKFSNNQKSAEFGYELLPGMQGKGIMLEASSEVIKYGFQQLGLKKIVAASHNENQRSAGLLTKLNFKNTGIEDSFVLYELTVQHWTINIQE